jgi:hypothetical protein
MGLAVASRLRDSSAGIAGFRCSAAPKSAICSETHHTKKAPAKAGAFDPMNGFGKISTSRRPGRQSYN